MCISPKKVLNEKIIVCKEQVEKNKNGVNMNRFLCPPPPAKAGHTLSWLSKMIYSFTMINDLEKFIKTNRHLPGIPNAEDVANNGIELGDMQARMLQKIEELTLYIIELKKENEEIKKMVNTKKE